MLRSWGIPIEELALSKSIEALGGRASRRRFRSAGHPALASRAFMPHTRAMARKQNGGGKEWSCGVISLPRYVTGEGEPYRPELMVWIGAGGELLGFGMRPPGESIDAFIESFHQVTRSPMVGAPHVPARVRVESPELAAALGTALASATRVVCAPTPELEYVAGTLRDYMDEHAHEDPDSAPSYLDAGVGEAQVAAFFDAAAGLFRAAPWKSIPGDTHPLSLTIEQLDVHDYALSVIGQMGESFGLVLLSTIEGYEEYLDAAAAVEEGAAPELPPHFFIAYERGAELDPALRKEIAAHGWPVAGPRAYPWCVAVDDDMVGCPPDTEELTLAEATLRALTEAMKDKRAVKRACSGGEPFEHSCTVTTHAGPLSVVLRLPYSRPETPDLLGRLASLACDGEDTAERHRLEDELFARFARSPEASAIELPGLLGFLTDLAADYHGETLATLSPDQLEDTLFQLVPRKVSIGAELARPMLDELRALFAFMHRELDSKRAGRLLDMLDESAVERLEEALDDPDNFGMAKSAFMQGKAEGFDMESEQGIDAWFSELRKRSLLAAASPSSSRARTPAARKKRAKRKSARKARRKSR